MSWSYEDPFQVETSCTDPQRSQSVCSSDRRQRHPSSTPHSSSQCLSCGKTSSTATTPSPRHPSIRRWGARLSERNGRPLSRPHASIISSCVQHKRRLVSADITSCTLLVPLHWGTGIVLDASITPPSSYWWETEAVFVDVFCPLRKNALLGILKMDERERNQKLVPEGTALQIERPRTPFPLLTGFGV